MMNVEDILLIIAGILCLLFFVLITIANVVFIVYYLKKRSIGLDLSCFFKDQGKTMPNFSLSFKELLIVIPLLIIGIVWHLCIFDTLGIPMIMMLLALCQIPIILYTTRKMDYLKEGE